MMVPILKTMGLRQITEIFESLGRINYLSIQAFSVAGTFLLENEKFNTGYYFNLLQLYGFSISQLVNKIQFVKNLNFLQHDELYIISSILHDSEIAIVGIENNVYMQLFTDAAF